MITVEDVLIRLPDGADYDDELDGWLAYDGFSRVIIFEPAEESDEPVQRFSVSVVEI